MLTINALTAATGVIVPVQCEYYALEGLASLINTVEQIAEHLHNRTADANTAAAAQDEARFAVEQDNRRGHHCGDALASWAGVEALRVQIGFTHHVVGQVACAGDDVSRRFASGGGETDCQPIFIDNAEVAGVVGLIWFSRKGDARFSDIA